MTTPSFFNFSCEIDVACAAYITDSDLNDKNLASRKITRLSSLNDYDKNSICFIESKKHITNPDILKKFDAAAVFCRQDVADLLPHSVAKLICKNPYVSFCILADKLYAESIRNPNSGIKIEQDRGKFNFFIDPTAKLEENVKIEPGCYIGKNAYIGANTILKANSIVADNCCIGRDCFIGYNVSLQFSLIGDRVAIHSGSTIGSDGFGYVTSGEQHIKIPHFGRVIVQDDVEIGANTTIDRGSITDTIIGQGTKIDNLVQIGHNVVIGRNCLIAAHSGIAGSVHIGDYTALGGRSGIKDHVKIGSKVQIVASSGVMHNIPDGEKWGGIPALPVKQWMRQVAALRKIVKFNKV